MSAPEPPPRRVPETAPEVYRRWLFIDRREDWNPPPRVADVQWHFASDEQKEFWRSLDVARELPAPGTGEVRTCYCGTTATVVPGVFPHDDCDGSVVAAAAVQERSAPGLREALEATLADWRDDAVYRPTDTRDEITEHYAVTACADTLAGILADNRQPTPEVRHWDGAVNQATRLIDWILASGGTARYHDGPSAIAVNAPGFRTLMAVPGDWIVRMPDGTFRVLSEDTQPAPLGTAWRLAEERQAKLAVTEAERNDLRQQCDKLRNLLDVFTHEVIGLDDGARLVGIDRLARTAHAVRKEGGLPVIDQFSKPTAGSGTDNEERH